MPVPTPNTRGAEFWNSTMGHSWVAQQAVISDVFTSVTSVSLDAAAAKAGEHVIDIGCGTGDTLLAFAGVVGPSGAVLGGDVSVPMLDFAKHGAAEARLGNAVFALADATSYAFEPRWADLVYSRFGVMFFDDPIRAFANIRSGMKAGGRLVFVCFRTLPESQWFRVPIDGKDTEQSMAFITQAGPLPALLENASSEQRIRATEAVRNALAADIGAD